VAGPADHYPAAQLTQPRSRAGRGPAVRPALPWVATGLLIAGVVFLTAGAPLITFPVLGASREHRDEVTGC